MAYAYAYLEMTTSYQKFDSVNRCVFTRRTIVPNFFSQMQYETTEVWEVGVFKQGRYNRKKIKNNKKIEE